ncbi:MAG TPA: hypothetical protein VL866_22280, partial [Pyrinomonadaceae bacterium]|nr:hypothetical protein [Pyrinomonadaceae bacterium]
IRNPEVVVDNERHEYQEQAEANDADSLEAGIGRHPEHMNTSEAKARHNDSSREGSNERKNERVSELRHRWNSEDI